MKDRPFVTCRILYAEKSCPSFDRGWRSCSFRLCVMGIFSLLWKSTTFSTERLISVVIWEKMASFLVLITSEFVSRY